MISREFHATNPEDLVGAAQYLLSLVRVGDIVCLEGPLGSGKTTFVRQFLSCLNYHEPVRSPTFNLVQTIESNPPVLHADLYRLATADGFGLEDEFQTHLNFIEWPDRLQGLVDPATVYWVEFSFAEPGRNITITLPVVDRQAAQDESS